jgi:GNAT superfamily N-acetyltransferase
LTDVRINPWPDEGDLGALMRAAWDDDAATGNVARLKAGLVHAGAYDGERLVGFVNVAWDGGIHAFILDTSVHPDYRRQGIGADLVHAAAEAARERGAVWLHVDYEPQYASFYERCGFRHTAAGIMRLG